MNLLTVFEKEVALKESAILKESDGWESHVACD